MASLMSKSIKVGLCKNGEELVGRSMTSFMALGGLVVPAGIIIQKNSLLIFLPVFSFFFVELTWLWVDFFFS